MEVFLDTTSHWSMFLAGGLCGTIGKLLLLCGMPYVVYAVLFGLAIGVVEYVFGKVFNADFSIWDYRNKRYNIDGQVCLQFMLIWTIFMPLIIIFLDKLMEA